MLSESSRSEYENCTSECPRRCHVSRSACLSRCPGLAATTCPLTSCIGHFGRIFVRYLRSLTMMRADGTQCEILCRASPRHAARPARRCVAVRAAADLAALNKKFGASHERALSLREEPAQQAGAAALLHPQSLPAPSPPASAPTNSPPPVRTSARMLLGSRGCPLYGSPRRHRRQCGGRARQGRPSHRAAQAPLWQQRAGVCCARRGSRLTHACGSFFLFGGPTG